MPAQVGIRASASPRHAGDFDLVVVEQGSGGVVDRGLGDLVVDLGLEEVELGLGEPGLGVEDEEVGLRAELVFALVGGEGFPVIGRR